MKVVYIAGPYSAPSLFEVEHNVRRSKAVALELAKLRIPFFSPVCHTAHFETYLDKQDPGYRYWIDFTLEMLERSDALFMVPGWESSSGATGEYNRARYLGMSVFFEYDSLLKWFKENQQ